MRAALHNMRSTEPPELDLLLVDDSSTPARSWQVRLQIQGEWPQPPIAAPQPTVTSLPTTAAASWPGLISALLGALVGGLLLNLMPCVLPVLAIKVLSLTRSTLTPLQRQGIGTAYALGVLSSMLALALLVMGLRAAGAQLGWGFQLQSPGLVAGLALLFTLIALNLWGLLEWRGQWVSGFAAQMARHPVVDAFLSGVLAVVVAAPCTAPFMGASVGVAFTLPAWQGLLIFLSLGTGLALPFTLSAWIPAAAAWLPKPGAWMQVLRQTLAFPMLLTVVWLLWVFSKQAGEEAAALLLAGGLELQRVIIHTIEDSTFRAVLKLSGAEGEGRLPPSKHMNAYEENCARNDISNRIRQTRIIDPFKDCPPNWLMTCNDSCPVSARNTRISTVHRVQ